MINIEKLKFDEKGLLPVITQDEVTGRVVMMAYANETAVKKTLETGLAHYWSRSRGELWLKGKTSGNYQYVKEVLVDCDGDALLYLVKQDGVACHTGKYSCFEKLEYQFLQKNAVEDSLENTLKRLYSTIVDRREKPVDGSYTNYLFDKGLDKMLKKVGEESAEVIIAAKNQLVEELRYEISDLLYHLTVLMVEKGLEYDEIFRELKSRER